MKTFAVKTFWRAVACLSVAFLGAIPVRAETLRSAATDSNGSITATAVARPNLIPQNVSLSTFSVRPGDQLLVAWTMTNAGSGNCPASFTGLHLGVSATIPPSNDSLNLTFTTPEIPARSAIRQTNSVTIPSTLSAGTYYLWVIADDVTSSTLNQTSRADDAARASALAVGTVILRPNLIPQNVTLSGLYARPGDQVTVAYTLTNSGNAMCPASITGLHLGTSTTTPPTSDGLDLAIATPEIPANSAIRITNTVTIPQSTTLGTYYVWVIADDVPTSTLNQTSRADDAARSPALSVVNVVPRPNLIPQQVTLSSYSARRSDTITVMWTTTNAGNGNCPASVTGLHLGTSATAPPTTDILNLRVQTPEIAANSSVRQTNTITIPAGTPLGTFYLWVVSDDVTSSTLNQTSRADDAARSLPLVISTVVQRPNLVPQNVVLSAYSARPGDAISIAYTITNSGNGFCPASLTGIHLGTSATTPPTSDGLNLRIATPEIPANSSIRVTNTVTVPANATVGNYYLWVVVDDVTTSTLNQTSRADDAARSQLLAVATTVKQPNLVPLNLSLSASAVRPGDQLTVTWAITNSGTAMAPASFTGLRIHPSATIPPTNTAPFLTLNTPEIAAGGSFRFTNIVTIPADFPLGTNYVWIIADDVVTSTLNQTTRADDAARSPALAIVSVFTRPNLVPQNIVLSSYVTGPGEQITVAWTMTNSGNGNCPASVTGLHLGTSATTPPTTDPIDLQVQTPAINANSAIRQTNAITIPANTPLGTYYVWVVADDVASSTLNQTSRADDAARSATLTVATLTLVAPASGATVDAPPTFSWTGSGPANPKIYVSNKPAPIVGTDTIVFLDNPNGSTSFTPSRTNWITTVNTLGVAQNYYWTLGSGNASAREVYADWIPFKTRSFASGATIAAPTGEFRFTIIAPNQAQVVIQASDALTNWADIATVQNTSGTVTHNDSLSQPKRFYRAKP